MLSDFEAAVEAALLRQSISSRDIADPSKSIKNRNEYLLKNSEGRVVDKISLERVNQLKDPEELKKAQDNYGPQAGMSKEELEKERQAKQEEIEKRRQIEKELFDKKLSEGRIKQWDYKHIRLDYKGRGITQEINILDIDGERLRGWSDNFSSNEVPTLPELFERLGNEGWEMISHVVNQDLKANGTTMHYYNFKREKL